MDVAALAERFGVSVEVGSAGIYPRFLRERGERLLVLTDENTLPFAEPLEKFLSGHGRELSLFCLPEREPVADVSAAEKVVNAAEGYGGILAVGSGTLNDLAKRAGFLSGKPSFVLATAPSMDGYTSGVTPLIENGRKITRPSRIPAAVLLDYGILSGAPQIMIGAGVGDILAKYCSLADWRLGVAFTGEEYNEEAARVMSSALGECANALPALRGAAEEERREGIRRLMDALLVSGFAMAIAGSSRPASGAEHHMSHYLETNFLARGERIPLHGIKVGLGTAVSLWLYHTLKGRGERREFAPVYAEAERLPESGEVLEILRSLGCPVRFSQLGVSRETVRKMFFEAYRIRDRFTVLTLYCRYGLMEKTADELLERFY